MRRSLALLATPALAQDDRVLSAAQMTEGLTACIADAAQCRVESVDLTTDKTADLLAAALTTASITATADKDDNGCPRFQIATGATATRISGDDDTSCTSNDTSAIRFDVTR